MSKHIQTHISDKKPWLGWTNQKRKNQALLRAVALHDFPGMIDALKMGAKIEGKGALVFSNPLSKREFQGTPLFAAMDLRFTEGACFLLEQGAKFGRVEIRAFIEQAHHLNAHSIKNKNIEFLKKVGLALVARGWDIIGEEEGGDLGDVFAYERAEIERLEAQFPEIVQPWKALREVIQTQQQLEKLPKITPATSSKSKVRL